MHQFSQVWDLYRQTILGLTIFVCAALSWAQSPSAFETPEYFGQIGLSQVRAAQAYAFGYTGEGVVVGVLDTGIAGEHPEFQGQLLGGYDFYLDEPVEPGRGVDLFGHGSHVNGIISARRDGVEMHGIAFGAQLYSVRIPRGHDLDEMLSTGWNHLATQGLPVINNSLGVNNCRWSNWPPCNVTDYTPDSALRAYPKIIASLRRLTNANGNSPSLMVFATGNELQPHPDFLAGLPVIFPEFKDNWLAVAALDPDNRLAPYSNRCGAASNWCISAPGGGDHQTTTGVYSVNAEGGYVRMSGTSMAAPHVAGAAALVKQAYPFFNARHLQQTLLTTATALGDRDVYGWGLLNAGKAVRGPAVFVDDFDVDTLGYDAVFHNDIGGSGGLIKRGAGELTLAGVGTYRGDTRVLAGKLVVAASVASAVEVGVHGTLGGSGRVARLDNAGTLAPGHSVGVLTVDGDYISRQGSRYEVEIDAHGNDQIRVGGLARLEGGTVVMKSDQRLSVGNKYSIISAPGGILGQYDDAQLEGHRVFLSPTFDAAHAGLLRLVVSRSQVPFASYLHTQNQHAVGAALDSASTSPATGLSDIYDSILNDMPTNLPMHMDELSGEVHASTQSVMLQSGEDVWRVLQRRMQFDTRSDGLLSYASGINARHGDASSAHPLWAQLIGGAGTLAGDGNASQVDTNMAGLFLGLDRSIGDDWRLGVAFGYTDGRARLNERSSRADLQSYTFGLYGTRQWTLEPGSHLRWSLGATYTQHAIATQRVVTTAGQQTLKADYSAQAFQGFTELSYTLPIGANDVLEPYVGLNWLSLRNGGFYETGGAAALQGNHHTDQMMSTNVGVRGRTKVQLNEATLDIDVGFGWRHAEGDLRPQRQLAFVQANDLAFSVSGAPIAKDAALVDLGVRARIGKHSTLGVIYSGQFAQGAQSHSGALTLTLRF